MKLAIVNITRGGLSGGYEKYLKNMLPRLALHNEIDAILCASPKKIPVSTWFDNLPNVKFTYCMPFVFLEKIDTHLHNELEKFKPDVIFIPLERHIRFNDTPIVCLFQNMLPMSKVQPVSKLENLRNKIQRYLSRKAARKADRIIAVSSFVSNYIQSNWEISSDKIGVVYHGVKVPPDMSTVEPSVIPSGWQNNFIFSAGAIESYRGLEDIILGLKHLRRFGYDSINAVFAGPVRRAMLPYLKTLNILMKELDLIDNVIWAGILNKKEMAWCFKNASIFVMTSRVEACPNTALEAMSHGKIIISSTAQPMYEIFKDAAIYYETGDEMSLANCIIDTFYFSDTQIKRLSQAAVKRALEFTWSETVRKTVDQLKKACKQ